MFLNRDEATLERMCGKKIKALRNPGSDSVCPMIDDLKISPCKEVETCSFFKFEYPPFVVALGLIVFVCSLLCLFPDYYLCSFFFCFVIFVMPCEHLMTFGANKSKYKKYDIVMIREIKDFDKPYNDCLVMKELSRVGSYPLRRLRGATWIEWRGTEFFIPYPIKNPEEFLIWLRSPDRCKSDLYMICSLSEVPYPLLRQFSVPFRFMTYTVPMDFDALDRKSVV